MDDDSVALLLVWAGVAGLWRPATTVCGLAAGVLGLSSHVQACARPVRDACTDAKHMPD